MARGKRKIIYEFNGVKFTQSDIDKRVYNILKNEHGVKSTVDIDSYINMNEGIVYSVVEGRSIRTPLTSIM